MKMSRITGRLVLLVCIVSLSGTDLLGQDENSPVKIQVHADQELGVVEPLWRFFGYDEANYTFLPEGKSLLERISQLHPQPAYIRCHHLLTSGDGTAWLKWSSTNVYTEDEDGNPVFDWTILDRIFDTYHQLGLKPLVELGFMPEALSSNPQPYTPNKVLRGKPQGMVSGGAFYPPKDYDKWQALIEALVRHCIQRYGADEAASWYWEPWNEPNIGYWKGTPEEYFKLYDYTAAAIKKVLPDARVGGPHVTNPTFGRGGEFLRDFLNHCLNGTNAVTGQKGTPLDFIAFHDKGGTSLHEDHVRMNLGNQLKVIQQGLEIIADFPQLKGFPVIIGECDPDGCAACSSRLYPERGYRNGSQYAVYTAASFLRMQDLAEEYNLKIEGALTWAFLFPDQPWFDGLRTLSTNDVPKPVFNAFRMFSLLQPRRIRTDCSQRRTLNDLMETGVRRQADIDAFASRGNRNISILIWHYHDDNVPGITEQVLLAMDGLPEDVKTAKISHYRIDEDHSNAYTAWQRMGSPQQPTPAQVESLKKAAQLQTLEPEQAVTLKDGKLSIQFNLPRLSLSLVDVQWSNDEVANTD